MKSLRLNNTEIKVTNYHDDFLLLTATDGKPLTQIGHAIFEQKPDFADEVIVTETEICLKLNQNFHSEKLRQLGNILSKTQTAFSAPQIHTIPVYFQTTEDWKTVENHTGLSKTQIIEKLTHTTFSLAVFGFLPGFLYLDGLDKSLHIPRKTVPAKYTEAGSVALGGKYLGLYSIDSPGGWHIIGKTPLSVLRKGKLPPVLLHPGDEVRIEAIDKAEYERRIL